MCLACNIGYGVVAPSLLLVATAVPQSPAPLEKSVSDMSSLQQAVDDIVPPTITAPQWLKDQEAKQAAAAAAQAQQGRTRTGATRTVTYDVMTRGTITASVAEFKQQANETLNDRRGWARMGVKFQEVASGGMFTLVLSEASQVPTFAAPGGCSAEYSCRVGRFVIINQNPWLGATPSWNSAGGSLRDYRHMVVNHETGHWLGHGHSYCTGAGHPAPVMQQQSMNLQGCSFNAWPVASELWSTQLGITR